MGILSNLKLLFNKDKANINDICKIIDNFFAEDKYISVKDLNKFIEELKSHEQYDALLKLENTSSGYFRKKYNYCFENIKDIVKEHNDKYVKIHMDLREIYLDNILKDSDPNICLDKEQREVVLRDEDYTLVIAGAGAGKSTTVAAKVKYLVDIKKIDPKEILIISFTNKAVDELKQRINKDLKIDCPITTFHSTGHAIIRKTIVDKINIVNDGYLYKCLEEFIQNLFSINPTLASKALLFFSYYIDIEENVKTIDDVKNLREFSNYETIKSQIAQVTENEIKAREQVKTSIKSEILKSVEEVKIANFLYLNGIEYSYEEPYPYYIDDMRRPYLPDFTIYNGNEKIYLEHFGITEDGKSTIYNDDDLNKYIRNIEHKKRIHRKHNSKLIFTYSKYNDGRNLLDDLKEKLIENNIEFKPRDEKEVYEQLSKTKDSKCFRKLIKLLLSFISNFKTNGFTETDFTRLSNSTKSERDKVFLEIAEQCYLYYQGKLKEKNAKDFQDLINDSTRILEEVSEMKQKLSFKYIIIDEYQDISLQRFNLTKKLAEVTDAKIIAVGDDWQSIYAFAGSQLKLFTDFKESMGYADILQITHTYRNSQELINIAGEFIQKNDMQFKKELKSPKSIKYPIAIFTYGKDENKETKTKKKLMEEKGESLQKAIDTIVQRNKKEDLTILLLGRFGFDCEKLKYSPLFDYIEEPNQKPKLICKKYPNLNIDFLTAHSSKGLGRDEVIIINGESGIWGFPSEKTHDPVLNMVIHDDISYEDAEERRLFYVALTRTKNRVYVIAPQKYPSKFLLEIVNKDNVYCDYEYKEENIRVKRLGKYCPHCGFPIYLMNSLIEDKKMYICSNDSEVCGFISNNLKGGKTSIKKCPKCKDGYLLIKKKNGEEQYFLGCTNYKQDKTGCSYMEPLDQE